MTILRTPENRFQQLPDYPFAPHYMELDGLRIHYVDEGQGPVILCLHGEPTWSFLYRHIILQLRGQFRVIAPDLIGFGKSDKFADQEAYSFELQRNTFAAFVNELDLKEVTLVVHDWGGPTGLWTATQYPERFSRLVVLNTFLSTGQQLPNNVFRAWSAFSRYSPLFPVGQLVQVGTKRWLPRAVTRAYDAPFPARAYKAGARIFPQLVPTSKDDPAVPAMRATFRALRRWQKPALVMFSDKDPILGGLDAIFRRLIPGSEGQPEITIRDASHFLQEDKGDEIAEQIRAFMQRTEDA
jgi:haloalkane dehalogenase